MKSKFWHTILMTMLIVFVIGLSSWAIIGNFDTDQRITIFGIVGVVIAAITSVYSVAYNHQKSKEREYEQLQFREFKKVLEHFYNALFESIKTAKNNKPIRSEKVKQELLLFKRGLMNWGNENIINAYYEYDEKLTSNINYTTKQQALFADQFLKSIRKELKFKDTEELKVFSLILTEDARREFNA
ncbi:MAG: hypothetical protein K9G70_12585 [Prolixibacteraceae bacterium]|nr:hypothetical protein [Prolixibacteraceae bacterium]